MAEITTHTVVPLSWLAKAQEITETLATPHRLFDVEELRKATGEEDPLIGLTLTYVEFANTGIRSSLERYMCVTLGADGETPIHLWVDLIEGLVDLAPKCEMAVEDEEDNVRANDAALVVPDVS